MSDGLNDTKLKEYVERIIRLHETRKDLADDVSDLLKEAASNGYDKDALKETIKIVMEPADKRQKRMAKDDLLSVYLSALGLS